MNIDVTRWERWPEVWEYAKGRKMSVNRVVIELAGIGLDAIEEAMCERS